MYEHVYPRAWALLLARIEAKTSWGRNELKEMMLASLVEAGQDREKTQTFNTVQHGGRG